MRSLLDGFGHAEICRYQPLALAATFAYSLAGEHERARSLYEAATTGCFAGSPPDGSATMESAVAILRSSVAFEGVEAMMSAALRARALEPSDSEWRPLVLLLVAIGHLWSGDSTEAEACFDELVGVGEESAALVADALAQRAFIKVGRDDADGAVADAEAACDLLERNGLDAVIVAALSHGVAAAARLRLSDFSAADRHLDAARLPMSVVSAAMPLDALQARIVLGDAATRLGRVGEARTYIEDATDTVGSYPDTGVLAGQLEAVRRRFHRASTSLEVELSDRERAVLELMPSELSVRQIAEALYLSPETVRSHRRSIYRKLSVGSRFDAVIAARRAGLLLVDLPTDGGIAASAP